MGYGCRSDHHLCEEADCVGCLIAFASSEELAQHRRERHSRAMPRFNRARARILPLGLDAFTRPGADARPLPTSPDRDRCRCMACPDCCILCEGDFEEKCENAGPYSWQLMFFSIERTDILCPKDVLYEIFTVEASPGSEPCDVTCAKCLGDVSCKVSIGFPSCAFLHTDACTNFCAGSRSSLSTETSGRAVGAAALPAVLLARAGGAGNRRSRGRQRSRRGAAW